MTRIANVFMAAAALTAALALQPTASRADNGQVAAGVIRRSAVGTLFGAAIAQPSYYAPGACLCRSTQLLLDARTARLGTTHRGIWVRPRMQVCDELTVASFTSLLG